MRIRFNVALHGPTRDRALKIPISDDDVVARCVKPRVQYLGKVRRKVSKVNRVAIGQYAVSILEHGSCEDGQKTCLRQYLPG